jgi:hypothetical protein
MGHARFLSFFRLVYLMLNYSTQLMVASSMTRVAISPLPISINSYLESKRCAIDIELSSCHSLIALKCERKLSLTAYNSLGKNTRREFLTRLCTIAQ